MKVEAVHQGSSPENDLAVLGNARPVAEIPSDSTGQLAVEWVLIMVVILPSLGLYFPLVWGMIPKYFFRTAEVISLPFP